MSFEDKSETQRRNGEEFGTPRSLGDSVRHMKDKVKDFVEGVKDKTYNIGETAGEAKEYVNEAAGQAKEYVEHTTMQGMFSDVAGLIKRHPFPAMAVGMTVGFLLSRRRD